MAARPTPLLAAVAALIAAAGCGGGQASPRRGGGHARAPALPVAPSCLGALARAPGGSRCADPALGFTAQPADQQARRRSDASCTAVRDRGPLRICAFGTAHGRASATVALVGDSHAAAWRPALQAVAGARGWHGVSMVHSACPLSKAVRRARTPTAMRACARWKRAVFAWFRHHRGEVTTVFVAGLSGGTGVVARPGRTEFGTEVGGYVHAWRAVLRSARRVVVLRDTPKLHVGTTACVDRATAHGRSPARACAVSRGFALDPDPLMAAATIIGPPRVRTVDLTDVFCDRRRCYPVIGGVLVTRDETHLSGPFASSLGPVLLRAVDRLRLP